MLWLAREAKLNHPMKSVLEEPVQDNKSIHLLVVNRLVGPLWIGPQSVAFQSVAFQSVAFQGLPDTTAFRRGRLAGKPVVQQPLLLRLSIDTSSLGIRTCEHSVG
jgi:hypothetical protein